jgi:hypothetical protein
MGLGKTLTMISLVATDPEPSDPNQELSSGDPEACPSTSATLIIVPPPCTLYDVF